MSALAAHVRTQCLNTHNHAAIAVIHIRTCTVHTQLSTQCTHKLRHTNTQRLAVGKRFRFLETDDVFSGFCVHSLIVDMTTTGSGHARVNHKKILFSRELCETNAYRRIKIRRNNKESTQKQ